MRKVGLDPADLAVPDKWISAAAVARLLDASATKSGHPDFAVRLAEARRLSNLGATECGAAGGARSAQRAESPPPLRAQLQRGPPHAAGRVGGDSHAAALVRVRRTRTRRSRHSPWVLRRCTGSCVSASGGTGGRWPPASRSRAPADLETIHRNLGPGVQFEHDFTGVVFYARDLDAANSLSDPLMRPYAQRLLDSMVSPRAATGLGPGAGARRAVPPARQVLHEPGGPGTRHGQENPAPPSCRSRARRSAPS